MEKREKWTVGDKIVKKEVESRRGKKRSWERERYLNWRKDSEKERKRQRS